MTIAGLGHTQISLLGEYVIAFCSQFMRLL